MPPAAPGAGTLRLPAPLWVPGRRVIDAVPPASGAVVMGTGIVSIDLAVGGYLPLSQALLVLTGVVWAGLGLLGRGGRSPIGHGCGASSPRRRR